MIAPPRRAACLTLHGAAGSPAARTRRSDLRRRPKREIAEGKTRRAASSLRRYVGGYLDWTVIAINGLLSTHEILQYLLRAIVVLITIPFHESAHALVSYWLGDDTALRAGRLSMNPLRHFDPLGALCMLLGGVGWAKPVSVNPYKYRNPKVGMAVSAAAGPASNLLLAWGSMVFYKICYYSGAAQAVPALGMFWYYMVTMNLSLAAFNLIPVPPFDGSRIALLFLPQRLYFKAMRYERYIMIAVLALVFLGLLNGPLSAVVTLLWRAMLWATGFVEVFWG